MSHKRRGEWIERIQTSKKMRTDSPKPTMSSFQSYARLECWANENNKSYKVQVRLFELKLKHDLRSVSVELRGAGMSLRLNTVTQLLNTAQYVNKLDALWQALNHSFITRYSPHHFSIFSDRSLEIMSMERSIVDAIEPLVNHGRILRNLRHPLPESIKQFVTRLYLFNSLEWESMKGKPRRDTYPRTLEFVPSDPPGYWVIEDIPDCVLDPITEL